MKFINLVNPVKRCGDLKLSRPGISLTEILVVIAVMAILMGVSIPAAKQLMKSFESSTGTRQLINAALSNARAIAVRNQTYAGVRFQEDVNGNTYIIFIEHDPTPNRAEGFRVVEGRKPMRLPETVGVIDNSWFLRSYNGGSGALLSANANPLDDAFLSDIPLNTVTIGGQDRNLYYLDGTSFSIVFNASGKLTSTTVWVRNIDSISDTPGEVGNNSTDNIFNKKDVVEGLYPSREAMFYQDDYGGSPTALYSDNYGIGPELSRLSFVIFDKNDYKQVPQDSRVTNYLSTLDPEYISPYTGELVMEYREQSP